MKLCDGSDAFYFSDRIVNNRTFRVFNYRLTSWTEMLRPNAKNCRGTTFIMPERECQHINRGDGYYDSIPTEPELVCLPPEKFFNVEEGGVDHTQYKIGCSMTKLDGSLISTVWDDNDGYILKSKSSFESEQVVMATKWLSLPENVQFNAVLRLLTESGYTVNMEMTSPENRIVVLYQETRLTILNVRDYMSNMKTYYGDSLVKLLSEYDIDHDYIKRNVVKYENLETMEHSVISDMKNEEVGEGYVVEIKHPDDTYLVKVKNHKYLSLHKTKDSVNTPSRLFEAVINEYSDDLRGLFYDDPYSMNKLNVMEAQVIPIFNGIISTVESFHRWNAHLERKEYAIEAQTVHPELIGLLMNEYLGRENDYKSFAIKNMAMFNINEQVVIGE